jgi:hypothetical protein
MSEILSVTEGTLTQLQKYQIEVHQGLPEDLQKDYKDQAKAYTDFQIQLVKNLELRSNSNKKRLENEVNLVLDCPFRRKVSAEAYENRHSITSPNKITRS